MITEQIRKITANTSCLVGEGYLIVRAQIRKEFGLRLNNGKIESVTTGNENGMGVQAFTTKGACGFASANKISDKTGKELVEKAFSMARKNESIGCELNTNIFNAEIVTENIERQSKQNFFEISPGKIQEMVLKIHNRLIRTEEISDYVSWQTNFRMVEDFWCIGRKDTSLVSFFVPRAVIVHQGTIKVKEKAQSMHVHRNGTDIGVLFLEEKDRQLEQRTIQKAKFIHEVCRAEGVKAGNYPLIIDYGLAKGLAHEAFGHAVESDLIEESVLGEKGKLRRGLQIAAQGVDIVDGSIEGDWAYQPYSANGLKRQNVDIVKNGILENGLGDIFSGEKTGTGVSGAGRCDYFASVPLPRMTNIRLKVEKVLPLPESTNLMGEIRQLRNTLIDNDLLAQDFHLLLVGYRGGQVNPKTGDFVFQCDGMVNLADPNLKIFQPSIFSGKILSALKVVQVGLGSEHFDAIGTCGKAGQMVPSSGGSCRYIMLGRDENVRLGGDGK